MEIELNKIYNMDCLEFMKQYPDNFFDVILTSPPYNVCTKRKDCYYNNGYSDIDGLPQQDYIDTRILEFKEFERLIGDGVILYNISYHNENPILPTLLMAEIHNRTGLTVADIIVWKKSNAIPFQTSPTKLSRICELVYVVVKKQHLHTFKTNKEISKINNKTRQKFYKNYTNYVEAKNNDGGEHTKIHKASFSIELCEKLLGIYCTKGAIVIDPFIGTGTTAIACKSLGIDFVGCELEPEYVAIANKRLEAVQGSLF